MKKIWWISMRAVASLEICTLMCYFCQKYVMFDPKNYRGVVYHNTEEKCKIWLGTDLCVEKWHEEFEECSPNTWKSQNLHFNRLRLTKIQMFELKKYRGVMRYYTENHVLCLITLKGDTIFKEKLIGSLKTDIRNLVNFHASSP